MISINTSQRTVLAGKTGSGKTTLAHAFLKNIDRLIVVDTKYTLKGVDWSADVIYQMPERLGHEFRLIVRTDDLPSLGESLIRLRDVYVYIDELYGVFSNANKIDPAWRALWTRGREFEIGVWGGVQRPANIPLVILTESDHFFIFRLTLKEDRERLAEIVGVKVPLLPRYAFYYANPADEIYLSVKRLAV